MQRWEKKTSLNQVKKADILEGTGFTMQITHVYFLTRKKSTLSKSGSAN